MYLKAVELQGFKSFPDKTRLNFENDITAIVGPNGSGKSNISDAIRWVMGEQRTKQLRGEKMEDVIFGGTEKRGKLGYAQVSLIFDNSARFFDLDASEVVITRAYYRSGESEYSINPEQVRLKDVNELLMDTGLGRDGYSTIGQGRISEIISGSGKERREVLEEAAGISRYRYRKEEAERKLERTQENLIRINDRIAELELQVGPLKKQAEVAKQCLTYQEELKTLEVSLWLHNLDKLREQSEAVNNDYETAKKNLDGMHGDLDRMYAAGESLNLRMQDKTLEAERLRTRLSELEGDGAELESGAAVLRANLQNALAGIERLRQEMAEQESRAQTLEQQIGEYTARMVSVTEALEETETQTEQREYAALVARESEESAALTECRTLVNVLTERLQECREQEVALHGDILQANEKLAEIDQQADRSRQSLAKAQARLKEAATQWEKKRSASADAEGVLRDVRARLTALESDLKVADSRVSLLAEALTGRCALC